LRILITADWHLQKGLRTNIVLNFLDYIEEYYFENNMDSIYVLGDIFDRATNIKNEVFIPVFTKLYEMKEKGINFLFLLGNHDIINVDNDSIVETFKPIGKVIKEVEKDDGKNFTFLPYTKDEDKVGNALGQGVLFTHLPIADFEFDNSYHATEKNSFSRSVFESFSLVFTGHFHRHQVWNNIIYVGAPFQQFRDEAGQTKGFIVFDTDTENWELIEYTEAPTYTFLKYDDLINLASMEFTNKFVCVEITKKIKDFAKLKYILYQKGAVDIIPIFEKNVEEVKVDKEIKTNQNIEEIVRETILSTKVEGIDNNFLMKEFDEILKRTS
jgi:DNA repair exonuclease SbcCD nuclease subunit